MVARLDHITVIAPSLEVGAAYVEARLGVPPGAGRKHPGMATHNLLLSLGPEAYLEVIAVDPAAPPVRRPRWFGLDHLSPDAPARLAAWVASTDDIEKAAVPELGDIERMYREHHAWEMTVRRDGSVPLGGAAPLLIQRSSMASPAAAMPASGLVLRRLLVRHPAPSEVASLLAKIGLDSQPSVIVQEGSECSLVAEVQTPCGLRRLREA